MSSDGFFARYLEWQQQRSLRSLTNPFVVVWLVALAWIFFRWWPAALFTAWLAVCVALAVRKRRASVGR
ncbi:MAG TPA: hypothetical protein VGH79_08750 [Gaiellaceae bacterium]